MAKTGIISIETTNTFQNWLDSTNVLNDLMRTDVLTASALGDTTIGNASLVGTFSANGIISNEILRFDFAESITGINTPLKFNSPLSINTSLVNTATYKSSLGPRASFASDTLAWQVGFESATVPSFIISTGTGDRKFSLSTDGNLAVSGSITLTGSGSRINANVTGNLTGNVTGAITGNVTGNLTGNVTGNLTGDVTGNLIGNVTGSVTGNAGTVNNGVYLVGNQTISGTKTFSNIISGSITGNAGTVTNGVYTSRSITAGEGLVGGGNLSNNREISVNFATTAEAKAGILTTKVMSPAATFATISELVTTVGYIFFNGQTGQILKSRNLSLAKTGTGNYNIVCSPNIQNGSSNWGVVLSNVDAGVLSQTPIRSNENLNIFNVFVTSRTNTGFVVRATRLFNNYIELGGNDNNTGSVFGITAVDPTYVGLVVF